LLAARGEQKYIFFLLPNDVDIDVDDDDWKKCAINAFVTMEIN